MCRKGGNTPVVSKEKRNEGKIELNNNRLLSEKKRILGIRRRGNQGGDDHREKL